MCAFCSLLSDGPHWTEAGTDAGRTTDRQSGRARYLDRLYRAKLVNRILAHYGCTVSDWGNNKYIVRSLRGQTAIVDNLMQVWVAAEQIAKKPADPLDPNLLSALAESAPVERG